MSTGTDKYEAQTEREAPHSALEEFSRDERRPAVILLSALLLAATFFAIGIMFGRWTAGPRSPEAPSAPASAATTQQPQPPAPASSASRPGAATQEASPTSRPTENSERRYALLIANIKSKEAANSLTRSLEAAGYKDVRFEPPTAAPDSTLSILIGHYTREEAETEAARLKEKGGPRTKSVRVVEERAGQ